MKHTKFSVLLSVYKKENPKYLDRAIKSIWDDQILKPAEIVLVKDGPLTEELNNTINSFLQRSYPIKTVTLKKNQGLGIALHEGIKHCSYEWVARMDTDDIAMPSRFETQITYISTHPDIDVIGAWIAEFQGDINNITSIRKVPCTHAEITSFAKKRNPINHPVVMFRKTKVEQAGSYQQCLFFEDYWLWVRMLQQGAKFHNIQTPLLWFRSNADLFIRRGGWNYFKLEYKFQCLLRINGFISCPRFIENISIRFIFRIIPNKIRSFLYKKTLRTAK